MGESAGSEISISRRSFTLGAVTIGALHFVGSFFHSGSVALAFADDEGNTTFKIYALSREEVPIVAYDATDNKRTPVQGMKVTLTSCYNDSSYTAVTDENGLAVANIRALVEGGLTAAATEAQAAAGLGNSPSNDDDAAGYAGYVRIEAADEGYRTFIEPSTYVESGISTDGDGNLPNVVQVPTQPDGGAPYLSCVSLDGTDVQYLQTTVGLVSTNDKVHTLALQVENATPLDTWQFSLTSSSATNPLATATAQVDAQGTGTATVTGQWLDGAHGIKEGDTLSVAFHSQSSAARTYVLRLPLAFEERIMLVPHGFSTDYEISPGLGAQDKNASQEEKQQNESNWAKLPDFLTLAGDSLCLGAPFTPVCVFGDTQGNIGISATIIEITPYARKDGEKKDLSLDERFKTFGSIKDSWWQTYKNNVHDALDDFDNAEFLDEKGNPKALAGGKWTSSLNVKFALMAKAYGKGTKPADTSKYRLFCHADSALNANLGVAYTNSKQFFVFGFPLVFAFDISAACDVAIELGFQCNEYFQNLDWDYKFFDQSSPFAIVIKLHGEVGVSLAAGILGLATIGIRGYGFLDLSLSTDMTPEEGKDLDYPHIKIQLAGHIQLVIQTILYKKTVQLDNFDPLLFYDNWDKGSLGAGASLFGGPMPLPNPSRYGTNVASLASALGESTEGLEMVSEESLAKSVEHVATLSDVDGAPGTFNLVKLTLSHSVEDAGVRNPYAAAPEIASADDGPSAGLTTTSAALDAARGNLSAPNGYNPLRGMRPTKQEKVWENVFSAPREKIVTVDGESFLLRLSTVGLNVEAESANLALVGDRDNCTFVKATEGNTLPKLTVMPNENAAAGAAAGTHKLVLTGGSLQLGETAPYPGDGESNVARLVGFENPEDYTEQQAQALVEALCGTDTLGTPTNETKVVRTRLTISAYNKETSSWGNPRPVEFVLPTTSTLYMRANSWDVDFDATAGPDGMLYVGLTSIVRPCGDSKAYIAQFERQFVTMLRIAPATLKVTYALSSISMLATKGEAYWYPHITACTLGVAPLKHAHVSLFYNYHAGDSSANSYSPMCIGARFNNAGFAGYTDYQTRIMLPERWTNEHFPDGTYEVRDVSLDGSVSKMVSYFCWTSPHGVSDIGENESKTVVWAYDHHWKRCFSEGRVLDGVNTIVFGPVSIDSESTGTARWFYTRASGSNNGGERLLRSVSCTTTYNADTRIDPTDAYDENWELGDTGDVTNFSVSSDGQRLYALRNMEGTMPAMDAADVAFIEGGAQFCSTYSRTNSPQAELVCAQDEEVRQYQLMCALWDKRAASFYEFFPVADLDFAPDSIHDIRLDDDRYDFILTSITNIDDNLLDIYHVAVPRVMCLQMEGAGCVTKFAMPGDTCRYFMKVANTGNVPIGGFTVNLTDTTGAATFAPQVLDDLGSLVVQDESMLKPSYDEDGIPTDDYAVAADARDASGILWPGKTRTYAATFTMPDTDGALELQVNISDPIAYEGDAAAALAADDALLTYVDPRGRLFTTALGSDATAAGDRVGASYEVYDDSGKSAAKTGGDNLGLLAALVAAGAAAAGATGYKLAKDARDGEAIDVETDTEG